MHDWLFSRQRYWGEPFPLYKTEDGQIIKANFNELPIELPKVEDYAPSSDGKSVTKAKEWVNQKDNDGNRIYRVTDTMPGWAAHAGTI